MLEIILYIVLVVGVVYFAYLYRQKWNKVKEEDLGVAEISMKPVEKIFESTKVVTKKVFGKIKSVDKSKILSFFKRIKVKGFLTKIKGFLAKRKNIIKIIKKVFIFLKEKVRKVIIFTKRFLKKVFGTLKKKFSRKQRVDLTTTQIENNQERKEELIEEKALEEVVLSNQEAKKSLFKKFTKDNGKIDDKSKEILAAFSKKGFNLFSQAKRGFGFAVKGSVNGVKKITGKIEIKKALVFIQELVKKVKIRVVSSEEDKKLKKQLNQKSDLAFKPEVFLGELLKKTEKDEKTRQVVEAKAEVKQETLDTKTAQLLEKEDIVEKIEHEIEEEIEKETIRIIEPQIKNINLRNDQVSQETIQKIEDELIGQIIDDPKNIEAYKRLGKIYYNQDKFEYARESFEMAIKLGSGDQKIKDLLRDCEEKIGK
jgi:hypothetical protein